MSLNAPIGFGTTGAYRNIEFVPSFNDGIVVANVDLALMPQHSVKIASNTSTTRNNSTGFAAANYVLGQNEVLTRLAGVNSLSGSLVNNLLNQSTGGIPYITQFGNATTTITPNNGTNTLRLRAGTNVTINTPTYDTSTINYTINSQTVLSTDPSPTLGGDLDVNNFYFTYTSTADVFSPVLKLTQTYISAASLFNFLITHGDSASTITLERFAGSTTTRDLTIAGFGSSSGVIINRIKSSTASTPIELASASTASGTSSSRHIILSSAASEVLVGAPQASSSSKTLVFVSSAGSVATNSANIRCRFYNGASPSPTLIGDLVFAAAGTTVGIGTTCAGNMILCANGGSITAGQGLPNAGNASIQFNSDLLMSGKNIRAVNNNITIDTFTNDFTGALVVKATNKSGFHRVKSGTRNDGTTTEIDRLSTSSATEKANKYMLYMQDTGTSSTCAIVEFTVLANNSTYALKINSIIKNGIGETTFVELKTSTSLTGSPVDETGFDPTPVPGVSCGSFSTTADLSVVIDPCLSGTFNYTLYKMSIQA